MFDAERSREMIIYKAQGIGNQFIPDINVCAKQPVPENLGDLQDHAVFYQKQAKYIADQFCASLPGGTQHALLIELLKRKECLLRVLP
jgi:hypothetical protein